MEHTSLNLRVKVLKENINKLKKHNNELFSCTNDEITNLKKNINLMKCLLKSIKLTNNYEIDDLKSKYTNIIKNKDKEIEELKNEIHELKAENKKLQNKIESNLIKVRSIISDYNVNINNNL